MGGSSSIQDINRQIDAGFNETIGKIKNGSEDIKNKAINEIRDNIANIRGETQKEMSNIKTIILNDFNNTTGTIKTQTTGFINQSKLDISKFADTTKTTLVDQSNLIKSDITNFSNSTKNLIINDITLIKTQIVNESYNNIDLVKNKLIYEFNDTALSIIDKSKTKIIEQELSIKNSILKIAEKSQSELNIIKSQIADKSQVELNNIKSQIIDKSQVELNNINVMTEVLP